MADPVITRQISGGDMSLIQVTWVLTTADPKGTGFEGPEWADRTWQFGKTGDTLGGAVGSVQGAHNDVDGDYSTLSNAAGATPLTFNALPPTTGAVKTVLELTRFMRPNLTTPGAGASITVVMVARRANPMRT